MHTRILIAKAICSGTVSAVLVVAARPSMTPKLKFITRHDYNEWAHNNEWAHFAPTHLICLHTDNTGRYNSLSIRTSESRHQRCHVHTRRGIR